MNPPTFRTVDKDGFPIPSTFDQIAPRSDEFVTVHRGRSWWHAGLVLAGAALVFGTFSQSLWQVNGRQLVARWYVERAQQKHDARDLQGAVADLDRAVDWKDDLVEAYYLRGHLRQELGELEGSLDDLEHVLRLGVRSEFAPRIHEHRSFLFLRLGRYREAIDEPTRGMEHSSPIDHHRLLNARAYARAIAEIELDEALLDIQRAIALGGDNTSYLDTRGYIYFLLGSHNEAMVDLNRAVAMTEADNDIVLNSRRHRHMAKERQEYLSVILHHRGRVLEALGRLGEAEVDLRRAEELGYNPAAGVF